MILGILLGFHSLLPSCLSLTLHSPFTVLLLPLISPCTSPHSLLSPYTLAPHFCSLFLTLLSQCCQSFTHFFSLMHALICLPDPFPLPLPLTLLHSSLLTFPICTLLIPPHFASPFSLKPDFHLVNFLRDAKQKQNSGNVIVLQKNLLRESWMASYLFFVHMNKFVKWKAGFSQFYSCSSLLPVHSHSRPG